MRTHLKVIRKHHHAPWGGGGGYSQFFLIPGMGKLRIDQDFLIERFHMMYIMSILSWMKFSFIIV